MSGKQRKPRKALLVTLDGGIWVCSYGLPSTTSLGQQLAQEATK